VAGREGSYEEGSSAAPKLNQIPEGPGSGSVGKGLLRFLTREKEAGGREKGGGMAAVEGRLGTRKDLAKNATVEGGPHSFSESRRLGKRPQKHVGEDACHIAGKVEQRGACPERKKSSVRG